MSWLARREDWVKQNDDAREAGDIDYARIIHSASFRRLQGKTQILNLGDSDFYRTRLTHSLEVAQIASSIVNQLQKRLQHPCVEHLPDRSLIQAIGCTHDLGHPPFGHGGEVALNYCMRDFGGFEGNGQTLRILSRLESFSRDAGANLSRRTLLGVLKYPISYASAKHPTEKPALLARPSSIQIIDSDKSTPPKCYLDCEGDVVDWILEPLEDNDRNAFQVAEVQKRGQRKASHKSLDCSIMDAADDIAYGVHDLEDAIALNLVSERRFRVGIDDATWREFFDELTTRYPNDKTNNSYERMIDELFGGGGKRKRWISRLVHHFITAVKPIEHAQFKEPLLRFRVEIAASHRKLLKGQLSP